MSLFPADVPNGPPLIGPTLQGVAIHWVAPVLPPPSLVGQRLRPLIPEPAWQVRTFPFETLTVSGSPYRPLTTVEADKMVRYAMAVVAVQYGIPPGSPVYYEVGT